MAYTYGEMREAIFDFTENQERLFTANVDNFIKNSEERILKSVQLDLFRKNSTASLAQGSKYLACPSDFLAPNSLSLTDVSGNQAFLEYKDVSFVQTINPTNAQGETRYYAQFDVDNFIVSYTPDKAYTAELHYLYRPQSLTDVDAAETTWMSINAPLSLLYGALIEAYTFMKGEQDVIAMYDKRFNESLMGLKLLGEAKETTQEYRVGKVIREKQ